LLSDFLDISPVAISWSGLDNHIEYINREWNRLFGYTLEDIPTTEQWFIKAYPHPDYRSQIAKLWDEKVKTAQITGQRSDPLEVEITCKDGTTRQVLISFVLISDRILCAFSDLTMIKLLIGEIQQLNADLEKRVQERTDQLMAVNQELEAFAYSVSHDLRAPLRAINGFSMQLLEDNGDQIDAQGHEYLQHILNTSQHMSHIINDLLKLSRVARSEMSIEQVDLSELVKRTLADLKNISPERDLEIILPDHIVVAGDTDLLSIAIDNLLRNAWKFTSKCQKTRIEFGMFTQEGKPVYFVKDNGAGFDMVYVDKLFTAFNRLHATSDYEGTGIGLAIVKRIILRHGGRVWAEGNLNQGAIFYFTLS
jgi:PAS domain S-box-containing protein